MSEALALIATVPETVEPAVGPVRLTVGAVVSLKTETVMAAEVVFSPAASGHGGQGVIPTGDLSCVPTERIGRSGVLAAQSLTIEEELHPHHSHIVRGGGTHRHCPRNRRAGWSGQTHRRDVLSPPVAPPRDAFMSDWISAADRARL